MATNFSFDGVTPFADAYKPRPSDAPDALDNVLVNAPNGAIVRGEVYWDAYRDPVSTVVLLDKKTGTISRSGIFDLREPLTLAVHVVTTNSVDIQQLAAIAACTFPLACPPSMAPENIASFIDTNLSAAASQSIWPIRNARFSPPPRRPDYRVRHAHSRRHDAHYAGR